MSYDTDPTDVPGLRLALANERGRTRSMKAERDACFAELERVRAKLRAAPPYSPATPTTEPVLCLEPNPVRPDEGCYLPKGHAGRHEADMAVWAPGYRPVRPGDATTAREPPAYPKCAACGAPSTHQAAFADGTSYPACDAAGCQPEEAGDATTKGDDRG